MIFSLLKLRKKTAAVIAGIVIALTCLWGMAMWQNISRQEMLNILLSSVMMIVIIAVCAVLLITTIKLIGAAIRKLVSRNTDDDA